MRFLKLFFFFSAMLLSSIDAFSQGKPTYKAKKVETKRKDKIRKLIGNVVFTHRSTIINCDSAYHFYKENRLEGFSNVHIKDGDSVTITSNKLIYEGAQRIAKLRGNVVYKNGSRILYTDILDYDLNDKVADFRGSGKLIDDENTLTSDNGRFFSQEDYAVFYVDVKLVSPTYDLESDTLEYSTKTKIAITKGPTDIVTDENTKVYAEGGEFKTAIDITIFDEGIIETDEYILEGDELFLDDSTKFYTAIGNVKLTSKNEDVIIVGDKGIYDQSKGRSKIFGNPVMKKLMELDTFFMSADTLIAVESDIEADKRILAHFGVKFFKSNLQGKCDSLSYFISDSTIAMYENPVIWNKNSQIEADSIDLLLVNDIIDKMNMRKNSFLASKDTLGQFNQMKGRNMVAYFDQGVINTMDINGNGESLYYALEGDSIMIAMNKTLCSDMKIRFRESKPISILYIKQVEAQFIPPHEITPEQIRLEGFIWREAERPFLEDVVAYYRKEGYVEKIEIEEVIEVQIEELETEINKNTSLDLKKLKKIDRSKLKNKSLKKLTPK
jgi:lipopolysaccharide export system protein LptA